MFKSFIPAGYQPTEDVRVPRERAVGGAAIGILVIDAWYPMLPGNVANAGTYDFPVMYKVLKGVGPQMIMSGDPAIIDMIISGGRELIEQGARAVVGACGSFANYQRQVAEALEAPTFLSVMLQVPLILQSLKPDQKLGVLAASAAALTPKVHEECGITAPERLVITEALALSEFQVLAQCQGRFNSRRLEEQLVRLAIDFVRKNPEIGALLLQCSDLPPYAWAIQQSVGLPVFDMNVLIHWVHQAVVRHPYSGII